MSCHWCILRVIHAKRGRSTFSWIDCVWELVRSKRKHTSSCWRHLFSSFCRFAYVTGRTRWQHVVQIVVCTLSGSMYICIQILLAFILAAGGIFRVITFNLFMSAYVQRQRNSSSHNLASVGTRFYLKTFIPRRSRITQNLFQQSQARLGRHLLPWTLFLTISRAITVSLFPSWNRLSCWLAMVTSAVPFKETPH